MAPRTSRVLGALSVMALAVACSEDQQNGTSPGAGAVGSVTAGSAGTTFGGGSVATGGVTTGGSTTGGTGGVAAGAGPTAGAAGSASVAGNANGGGSGGGVAGGAGTAAGGAGSGGAAGSGTAGGGVSGSAGNASGGAGAGGMGGNGSGGAGAGGMSGGGAGGSGGGGSCARAVGSCTGPTVKVTSLNLGIPVTAYGSQSDTSPLPMALAAIPSGGSRLAWLGTDKKVYIAKLDCDDQVVGTPFSIPAEDLQDLYADETGGVALVIRNATNAGTDNCGSGQLCGGTSSQCQSAWLVRFDEAGNVQWQTSISNLSDARAGYDNGAIFSWKNYQHHGRIAFDGTNYAAYYAAAISVYRSGNSGCIDIHEGDRMQVVDASGKPLSGHNSFDWGCSHSWTTRIAVDPANKSFVMTCATDADNCAIERPGTGQVLFQATCSGQFFNGDLVSSASGFWSAWSDTGSIRLNQFAANNTKGPSVTNAGASQHPHLVSYGPGKLLLAWANGQAMAAQVRDAATGDAIGSQLALSVRDHAFQAFKPYPDGSAAYPAAGDNNTSVKIARVMPCQ